MLRFCPARGGVPGQDIVERLMGLTAANTGFFSFEAVVGVLTARGPRTRLGGVVRVSDITVDT